MDDYFVKGGDLTLLSCRYPLVCTLMFKFRQDTKHFIECVPLIYA